jgi:hypothetical protein
VAADASLHLVPIFLPVTRLAYRARRGTVPAPYCLGASITETGLGEASLYVLHLVVAASLLAAPPGEER